MGEAGEVTDTQAGGVFGENFEQDESPVNGWDRVIPAVGLFIIMNIVHDLNYGTRRASRSIVFLQG
jgi:hypothetical protein